MNDNNISVSITEKSLLGNPHEQTQSRPNQKEKNNKKKRNTL